MTSTAKNDLLYESKAGHDDQDKGVLKVEKLYELLAALDEVALQTHNGKEFYPPWILKDVKTLYDLLRRCYDQVCRGIPVDVSRTEIEERFSRVREGIQEHTTRQYDDDLAEERSSSPGKHKKPFVPLLKHEPGSQYCLGTFRTVKHKGEFYHTPGRPNPDTFKQSGRRKWLKETVKRLKEKPTKKKTRSLPKRKRSSNKAKNLLLRAEMIEKRLLSEARRELHSEEMLERMRSKDNEQFMDMLQKLDMLIQALMTKAPAPAPNIERKVIVDDSRAKDLESQLKRLQDDHERERKKLLDRIEALVEEVEKARQTADQRRKNNLELEEEISRLRSYDGDHANVKSHLEQKLSRLEEAVQKHQKTEKRLRLRIEELELELEKNQKKMQHLKNDIKEANETEKGLRDTIRELQRSRDSGNSEQLEDRLCGVVSRVMLKTYIHRYRKQSQVRKQLERTVESLNASIQRQQRVHQAEEEATKDLMQKESRQLHDAVGQKRKVNDELRERMKNLQDSLEKNAEQHALALSDMRRSSLGEIQQLQLELFNLRRKSSVASVAPEPPDYGPFTNMMLESFQGDYLRMEDVPSVLHTMFDHGDKHVVFSDYIEKLNHRNFKQKRILLISQAAIFSLLPKGHKARRIFKLEDIDKVTLSRRAAHVCVIHHKSEPDYFFYTPKRDEIVYHLMETFKAATGKKLVYHFAERFYVEDEDLHYRSIEVPESQNVKLGKSVLLGPS